MSDIPIVSQIQRYQKCIEKYSENESRILHSIGKLYKLPVTVQHLQETGVGRTINALRKYEGAVGDASKALVAKWKSMVADEESSDDEDETCITDMPEGYSDNSDSPIDKKSRNSRHKTHESQRDKSSSSKHDTSRHGSKKSTSDNSKSRLSITKAVPESSTDHDKNFKPSEKKSKTSKSDRHNVRKEDVATVGSRKSPDNVSSTSECIKEINGDIRKRKHDLSDEKINEKKRKGDEDEKFLPDTSSQSIVECNASSVKEKSDFSDSPSIASTSKDTKNKDKSPRHKSKSDKHRKSEKKKDESGNKEKKLEDKHKPKDKKIKQNHSVYGGIDCNSGTSFADALGMCTGPMPQRKKMSISPVLTATKNCSKTQEASTSSLSMIKPIKIKTEINTVPSSEDQAGLSLLAPNIKLEPLSVDLASTLPEISTNYKPLPTNYMNPIHRKLEEDKALSDVMYAKNLRTKVYSGNKTSYTSVPSLFDLCIRVLIDNIEALEATGGVPYDIIKPVLERATAHQLYMIEHYNPYLVEDTDELWKFHSNREFRTKQREEMESWRDMYLRCFDEREAKLKTLTANIRQSQDKSLPVRVAKLAYVDNVVKPPRNVLRKQAKYGTANTTASSSDLKKKLLTGGPNAATNISVPPPPIARAKSSTGILKKNKAPLMAKTLQLIKGRYKR